MEKPIYLIIENEPANMKLFAEVLEKHDVSVLQAWNVQTGIALAKKEQPHVILMDLFLVESSGQDAIKILKSDSATKHIPVIAITSKISRAQESKTFIEGCVAVHAKPIAVKTFHEQIAQLLKERDTSPVSS